MASERTIFNKNSFVFAHLCDKQANGPKGRALSEFARMLRERF